MTTKAPNVAMHSKLAQLVQQHPNPETGQPYNASQLQVLTGIPRETLGQWLNQERPMKHLAPHVAWALSKFFGVQWWEVVEIVEVES